MSDELIFDSERQERKQRKRTWLIPLIVLAGILLAVVVVSLLLRSGKEPVHTEGEDTDYPFSWQVQADGSVMLELPHETYPAHRWVQTGGTEYGALSAEARGEKNGNSCFLLTPAEAGRALLELTLRKDPEAGAEEERVEDAYRLTVLVEVREEGGTLRAEVLNASGIRLQSEVSGGQDSENAYRIFRDENGYLVIAVHIGESETDWNYEIVSGQSSVTDLGMIYTEDEVWVFLTAGSEAGEGELILTSELAAAELRFRCALQEDGSLLVTSHEAVYGEKPVFEPAGSDYDYANNPEAETATEPPSVP